MSNKKKNLYEVLKNNKSLAPIARLAELAAITRNVAKEAKEVGDSLSVFACQAEAGIENVPPVEAWMNLCDYYKHCARDFSDELIKAIEVSHVNDIPKKIEEYTQDIIDKTIWTLENDPQLRRELFGDSYDRDYEDD